MQESTLNSALRQFEAVEANLLKAEKVLAEVVGAIPSGIAFGDDPGYESNCRAFDAILAALPTIDSWKPDIRLMELDEIAQDRLDALEVGEIECQVSVERRISEPSKLLREYRFRFDRKRRDLVRDSLQQFIDAIDKNVEVLSDVLSNTEDSIDVGFHEAFGSLKDNAEQMETLLGNAPRPARWGDLTRHLHFGQPRDVYDIVRLDWPSVRAGLRKSLYGENEPIPTEIEDIGALVRTKPRGPVATRLKWEILSDEEFERLLFALIADEKTYENPEWLMRTRAPDRGRDLSAYRVYTDPLSGTIRQRVVIQCKHWLSRSVGPNEVSLLIGQMRLWEPPRVDIHVIATSGRFTSDAVSIVEKHNGSDSALRIEMWAESHLERLLAIRPAIIAEFGLR